MMTTPLENAKSLIFFDKNKWNSELLKLETPPDVVLLSQWEKDEKSFQRIQPLVTKLLELGCKYFVCAGKYSESLHDFIDGVILDMTIGEQEKRSDNTIMTTWHDTDTDYEVADFFLHLTCVSKCTLVAFFDNEKPEDDLLKLAILNGI